MKKFFLGAVCAALCCTALFGAACNNDPVPDDGNGETQTYSVYAPDGAPALALTHLISTQTSSVASLATEFEANQKFDIHIVDSSTISSYVTGESPKADFCILPLNAASKLLGTGENYVMLGTVTNGNIYFLSTGDNAVLTPNNIEYELMGKTVGVVQLTNVPGLTLQAVLNDYDIEYRISSDPEEKAGERETLLKAYDATNVTPAGGCDYYLCPEPAASTKIKGTADSANPFFLAGDLQELYGDEEEGYPQAVLVVRRAHTQTQAGRTAIGSVVSSLMQVDAYLETLTPDAVLELLDDKRTEGLSPSFNANNLTETVIEHCSVRFTSAEDDKSRVNTFIQKLIAVDSTAAAELSDAFFYVG